MKYLKILFVSVVFITISLVTVQSCTSNYNESTEIDSVHLQTEKSNQINQESQLEDVSTITKSEYLGMTQQRKDDFKKAYVYMMKSGTCSCSTTNENGGTSSCEVNGCPKGTKPKCQDLGGRCDCSCEPFGGSGVAIIYAIQKNEDGSVILTEKKSSKKSLKSFANSNLPNAKEISNLLNNDPIFLKKKDGIVRLTPKDYYVLESKFQALMENYTIEQYFEVEYGF